jgi:hypothetical protein
MVKLYIDATINMVHYPEKDLKFMEVAVTRVINCELL